MTFLPIAERELRVAARKRSTFWLRIVAALIALIIAGGFLITAMVGAFPFSPSSFGKGLFTVLTWLSLAVALSAGLFFTSDCLSEEKREGTLGFLFLTDLRGYDVVFGKLLATSLRAICALLAVFPILGVTLLMGGVTGAQFWRTVFALVNALFISLATGMFVSAISRDSQKALSATLLLLVLMIGGAMFIDGVIAGLSSSSFNPYLSFFSPGYLFMAAGAWAQAPIALGVLANQLVGWTLIGLACVLLPRTLQEKGRRESKANATSQAWTNRSERQRQQRTKLLTPNPVLWLAYRHRWQRIPIWVVAILLVAGAAIFTAKGISWTWWLWSYLGGFLSLVLYLAVASQACRFFVEAQRTGLLELLLATPLTVGQIVQGQWRALLRLFALPLALCLLAQVLGTYAVQRASFRSIRTTPPPAVGTNAATTNVTVITSTSATGTTTTTVSLTVVPVAIGLGASITFLANLCALGWFGMWMGLISKNTNAATLKTLIFVQIIPWFVITFASSIIIPLLLLPKLMSLAVNVGSQSIVSYSLFTSGVGFLLALGKDVGFLFWARQKLYSDFRETAISAGAPIRLPFPQPAPAPEAPPVILQS